ncbi:MAG: glucose-6-phosphate isomerase [Nitrospirota bacterium]|nr:glucose-6-phosphate isomerase [Nitrospirota bacterium]
MDNKALWERFKKHLCICPDIGLSLDISRMNFPGDFFDRLEPQMQKAYAAMQALESGAIANPDENRMVGHYWLRAPELAPSQEISNDISNTLVAINDFAFAVHASKIKPRKHGRFSNFISIGIGGSALGPQFLSDALSTSSNILSPYFLDNTDPDGFDRLLTRIRNQLDDTLVIVISKSGGTIETRNGMIEISQAFRKAGLAFERHAVAITEVGSALDVLAKNESWIARFPMWNWVGGRSSITSAVGLLPMSLQGIDIKEFLMGAALCDKRTRNTNTSQNPAALLALMWYYATSGKGAKDLVILPYKDRLQLLSRYLQQLIMESLGKEKDLDGKIVNQGLSVYGNKGTTDQHSYVQQLRDGVNNFFATFIEVLHDRADPSPMVGPEVTSGDYLSSFLLGTRNALHENGRESITITLDRIDARTLGGLIALFERAVGFYASLINVNAYHQPGVEAGKKMASAIISLQGEALDILKKNPGKPFSADDIARALGKEDQTEAIFKILLHASMNVDHGIKRTSADLSRETFFES